MNTRMESTIIRIQRMYNYILCIQAAYDIKSFIQHAKKMFFLTLTKYYLWRQSHLLFQMGRYHFEGSEYLSSPLGADNAYPTQTILLLNTLIGKSDPGKVQTDGETGRIADIRSL